MIIRPPQQGQDGRGSVTIVSHDAHGGLFERHVQANKHPHGCPPWFKAKADPAGRGEGPSPRNALPGVLWLRTVLDFQVGVTAALDANDGLRAALHTPKWARDYMDAARLLLLYDRDDFIQVPGPRNCASG